MSAHPIETEVGENILLQSVGGPQKLRTSFPLYSLTKQLDRQKGTVIKSQLSGVRLLDSSTLREIRDKLKCLSLIFLVCRNYSESIIQAMITVMINIITISSTSLFFKEGSP